MGGGKRTLVVRFGTNATLFMSFAAAAQSATGSSVGRIDSAGAVMMWLSCPFAIAHDS